MMQVLLYCRHGFGHITVFSMFGLSFLLMVSLFWCHLVIASACPMPIFLSWLLMHTVSSSGLICSTDTRPALVFTAPSMGSREPFLSAIFFFFLLLFCLGCKCIASELHLHTTQTAVLKVDASLQHARQIPDTLFGIFFEVNRKIHIVILFCTIALYHFVLSSGTLLACLE